MRILITPTSLSRAQDSAELDPLRAITTDLVFNPHGRPLTASELVDLLPGVDAVIAGLDDYSAEVLNSAPQLRVISRYGVGVNNVDLAAAASNSITVTRTPGANSVAVAELAIGLCFAVARGIPRLDAQVREGGWPRAQGIEVTGKTMAVIGCGAIGRLVISRAAGIGMRVVAYDPMLSDDAITAAGAEPVGLDDLFRTADVVSLHVPLLESTAHIVNAERIAAMKSTAILINTSRGGLIDEVAARAALDAGHLHGVGLDAYENEPPRDSPLVGHPSVVSLPHSGELSDLATLRMASGAYGNLVDELTGTVSANRVEAPAR
ncbi:MAG: phosphoglycerate dehydrogenase [Mycetocola sp.]